MMRPCSPARSRLLPLVPTRPARAVRILDGIPWQLVLLKCTLLQEEDEAWLPGERRCEAPCRKPTWAALVSRLTCVVTVHSPGVRPVTCLPESRGWVGPGLRRPGPRGKLEERPEKAGRGWAPSAGGPFREQWGLTACLALGPQHPEGSFLGAT